MVHIKAKLVGLEINAAKIYSIVEEKLKEINYEAIHNMISIMPKTISKVIENC